MSSPSPRPLRILVTATGTEIGKTRIVELLVPSLRQLGRSVWVWKPVACGGWHNDQAEDARQLAHLVDDGQDPSSLCRHQWPEPASPHRAAAADGDTMTLADLLHEGHILSNGTHDLVVEGAGGLLSPLTSERSTAADLADQLNLQLVIVTTPDLGTFHNTRAVIEVARQRQLSIAGLVVNHVRPVTPSVATDEVAIELSDWCDVPLLGEILHHKISTKPSTNLAEALLQQQTASVE